MISFLSVFPPYRGGISKFSDSLYIEIRRKSSIRAYNFKKLYPPFLFPGTTQTLEENHNAYQNRIFHPYQPLNWNKAAEIITADNPDFILYSYWHPFFAPGLRWVLSKCKKMDPSILTAGITHNIMPHEYFPFKKILTEKLLDTTDITVVLSDQTEQDFKKLGSSSYLKKLFHPIYELDQPSESDAELRAKYGFDAEDNIILFMGLVRDYKGVDLLVEAFNQLNLKEHHIKPMIVGEFYNDKEALLNQINPADKSEYTIIDEFVTEETMSEILSIADLMVLPYRKASQSGILANAIYFNLPALVSDHPGLTEHISHMENGLIFESGNVEDLKNNISTYLEKDLKSSFASDLNRLKQQLSWSRFAKELLNTLESL